ncbi:PfkB family carbohydrate kinase [Altericista sp. CCNU0014]|uniref:PfkB family carbohydrate kinase n=1 Tax=Altericista sp. CCNU0014 TaxID=3082949 RepID=UPI00384D76DB
MGNCGLFVGLTTLDLIYSVPHLPQSNEKQVAADMAIAAGGPATNAAVTFRHFDNEAILLGAVGQHPLAGLVRADLAAQRVELWDLRPEGADPPPLSSILVTEQTGDRAVISRNAVRLQVAARQIPSDILDGVDIVLIDGHQLEASVAIAKAAQQQNIPVVLDGGSWKRGLEAVLPFVTYAICSANFSPPDALSPSDTIQYLRETAPIQTIAITHGGDPIRYWTRGETGEITVPAIQPVDTLGAGDIFHGAFCHWILRAGFIEALEQASAIAAFACQSFGTRQWLSLIKH